MKKNKRITGKIDKGGNKTFNPLATHSEHKPKEATEEQKEE